MQKFDNMTAQDAAKTTDFSSKNTAERLYVAVKAAILYYVGKGQRSFVPNFVDSPCVIAIVTQRLIDENYKVMSDTDSISSASITQIYW